MISDEHLQSIIENPSLHTERIRIIAAELLALRKARRDSWKLVPVEPTTEMLEEIWLDDSFKEVAMKRRYQAMLAAAPEPE